MAQPMLKENARPESGWPKAHGPTITPEIRARAEALERELGRPLRLDIEGPLTEEEEEEMILARLMDKDGWLPAEKLLEDFKHLLPDKQKAE